MTFLEEMADFYVGQENQDAPCAAREKAAFKAGFLSAREHIATLVALGAGVNLAQPPSGILKDQAVMIRKIGT